MFDTGEVELSCFVTFVGFDDANIQRTSNVSWFGPNGLIQNGEDSIITEMQNVNQSFPSSTLLLSGLNITLDNNTIYTCRVNVSVEGTRYEFIEPNSAENSSLPLIIQGIDNYFKSSNKIGHFLLV